MIKINCPFLGYFSLQKQSRDESSLSAYDMQSWVVRCGTQSAHLSLSVWGWRGWTPGWWSRGCSPPRGRPRSRRRGWARRPGSRSSRQSPAYSSPRMKIMKIMMIISVLLMTHLVILGGHPGPVLRGAAQVWQEVLAGPVVGPVLVRRHCVAPANKVMKSLLCLCHPLMKSLLSLCHPLSHSPPGAGPPLGHLESELRDWGEALGAPLQQELSLRPARLLRGELWTGGQTCDMNHQQIGCYNNCNKWPNTIYVQHRAEIANRDRRGVCYLQMLRLTLPYFVLIW